MPITGAGRWARAVSGQATTAPPRNAMSSRRLTRPPKSMQVQSIDFAGQLQSIAASQGAESDAGHEEPRNGSASTRRASLLYLYQADRIAASLSSVGPVPLH